MTEKPVINEPFSPFFPGEPKKPEQKKSEIKKFEPPVQERKTDDNGNVRLKEGKRLFNMKHWEQALRELRRVDAADFTKDEHAELAYYLGLCCTKLEQFDDALLYLEQVIAAGSDLLRVYQCRMTLSFIYLRTNRPKMAEYELKRLRNAGFESVPLYNTLGYSAYAQKRYRNAIEHYEKALEFDSDNTTALNCLGYILADSGIDPRRGLRFCRKAVEKNPQNPAYLDSLGWSLHKCGETADALAWLRKALDIAPQEKEIKDHYWTVTREAV